MQNWGYPMNVKSSDGEYLFTDELGQIVMYRRGFRPEAYYIALDLVSGGANKAGLEFIQATIDYMFTKTPALMLYGYISRTNLASRQVAAACRWASDPAKDKTTEVYRYITAGMRHRHKPNAKIIARRPVK